MGPVRYANPILDHDCLPTYGYLGSMDLTAIRVQSLASGSSGNALLLRVDTMSILIDCGLPPRELRAMLIAAGSTIDDINAVLLTHEHGDHTRGLDALSHATCSVVATRGTASALGIASSRLTICNPKDELTVGSLVVRGLPVSHDAAEPCGYSIVIEGLRCTILTDLGKPASQHSALLYDSDLIVIEANHDQTRLRNGPYPARLKQRVLSDRGHLSNHDCGRWLAESLTGSRRHHEVWLAHLSRTNNLPALARQTVDEELQRNGVTAIVTPLPRRTGAPVWEGSETRRPEHPFPVQLPLSLM